MGWSRGSKMGVVEIRLERMYYPIAFIAPTSVREIEAQLVACPVQSHVFDKWQGWIWFRLQTLCPGFLCCTSAAVGGKEPARGSGGRGGCAGEGSPGI